MPRMETKARMNLPPLPLLEPPPPRSTSPGQRSAFLAALAVFSLVLLVTDFVPVLDHFNLAMHEAGHLLFAIFGSTASLYGGTLMQFVFPGVAIWQFHRQRQPLAAAAAVAWGLQNLQYTALYMADARAQQLPLVGGGEHDWFNILGRWGLLNWDTRLAGLLELASWLGLAALAWWVWSLDRPPPPRHRRRSTRMR